jgi:L-rhamnose mutarotase
MKRHTFALKVNSGKMAEFRSGLGKIWSEFTLFLDTRRISNFSIWNAENIVFGYYETDDDFAFSKEDKKIIASWENNFNHLYIWLSVPFETMRLMYQDFGVVRKSKELIRHRVFITKLHLGTEAEYKRRHDALIEARGNEITKGPDSNFSIWYAGGYIFGYNEIDTTMEHEITEAERENTITWETKMLEIMDWITNDVDWITGECHETVKRIGWHN